MNLLRLIADLCGYDVFRRKAGLPYHGYDLEKEAREAIAKVKASTMVSLEKLIPLYQQAVFCERAGIDGAFVECGVWKGGCVGLMALANLRHGTAPRQLHLFDSFEGIPEPDAKVDGQAAVDFALQAGGKADGQLVPLRDQYGGVGTLESCRDLIEVQLTFPSEKVTYHKGWFQDTLPNNTVGPIAVLRLDGDWYESTKVCLDHLYDKVVPGGFVIVDDYGAYEGCKKAVDEFLQTRPVYLHHLDRWGRYWIKP